MNEDEHRHSWSLEDRIFHGLVVMERRLRAELKQLKDLQIGGYIKVFKGFMMTIKIKLGFMMRNTKEGYF